LLTAIVVGLTLVDFAGWALHIGLLTSVFPHYATMKPNTALCLLLLAAGLWVDSALRGRRAGLWLMQVLSAMSLLVSLLSLMEYASGRDFGIDQLLFSVSLNPLDNGAARMSVGSGIALTLTALAVLLRDRFPRVNTGLLLCGGLFSASALISFVLDAGPLADVPWLRSLAVHTGLCLAMLQVATLASRPSREPFRSLTRFRDSYLHRGHMLFSVTVLPVLLGIPVMVGVRRGWFDAAFAVSLLLVLLVSIQTYLLWSANVAIEKAAAALMQSEKLAAVGRLAASIAHEINNPLESVTNLLYLANGSEEIDETKDYVTQAERELLRISAITSQTLRFHKQSTKPRPVEPEELIESILTVYQGKLLNSKVTVEQRLHAGPPISCFEGEIRQVLSNLVGNAIDAMHPRGGRLLLRTHRARNVDGRRGIMFVVADTGPGISSTTLERIFEPFFTTKGKSGTGLGLWISREIAERNDGRLHVRSTQRAGRSGTIFTLFLPWEAPQRID
jgi:signal transduction histidine kinase